MRHNIRRLDSLSSSLVFEILNDQVDYLYFGKKLGKHPNYSKFDQPFEPSGLDVKQHIVNCFGNDDFREPALIVKNGDGTVSSRFVFDHVENEPKTEKDGLPSARGEKESIGFVFVDKENKLELEIIYSVFADSDTFTCDYRLKNKGKEAVHILKMPSLSLDIPETNMTFVTFNGQWARERLRHETKLEAGKLENSSSCGASSAINAPFTMLKGKEGVYSFNLLYSGNHKTTVEADNLVTIHGRTRLITGINDQFFDWTLGPGETFEAPEAVFNYGKDEDAIMLANHDFVMNHIIAPQWRNKSRPVLFNNWEGTMFDFNAEKVVAMARVAKEVGAELFVLDDGWFGMRENDHSSLGDWEPNMVKTGGGLDVLADRVRAEGLDFGIWIEPEMISPDSNLYRNRPSWAMTIPGKKGFEHRNQYILDLTNPLAEDYAYRSVEGTIELSKATYVKWDYNRHFSDMYPSNSPIGEYCHRYILALYRIMDKLVKKYPDVLFEGCAGGGSRYDLGILYYFPQIWTSDNTDCAFRTMIQDGTMIAYPQSAMTCHVSGSPNVFTQHTASLDNRFDVALEGNLGYELDSTKLNDEEKAAVSAQIAFYKQYRDISLFGKQYRLYAPKKYYGYLTISGDTALVGIYKWDPRPYPIRLKGLNKAKTYEVVGTPFSFTGEELMKKGLPIEITAPIFYAPGANCGICTKTLVLKAK